jgi:chromosome segregation ATPase
MTTKEHIRALEQECKELRAHIDKLESEPETLYRQFGETIQQERQSRRKAEARLGEANAENIQLRASVIETSTQAKAAEGRAEAFRAALEEYAKEENWRFVEYVLGHKSYRSELGPTVAQAALHPEPVPPGSANMPPCNDSYHLTNRAGDTEGGAK